MSYQQNNNYQQRPPVIKPDITPLIPQIHDLTERKWKDTEIRLIWNQQPAEMSPDDFLRMMYIAAKRGLDPLLRQIYATCRWSKRTQSYQTAIETTIDGARLLCDLTGLVDGLSEPEFVYTPYVDQETGQQREILHYCTISLFRKDASKPFTSRAYFAEYNGGNDMWARMPHLMLAKCVEMLVRRTAFPAALSGLYIREEMMQAEKEDTITPAAAPAPAPVVTVPASAAPAAPAEAPPARHGRSRKTDAPASAPAGQEAPAAPQSPAAEQVPPDKYVCADTGEPIVDWTDPADPNQTMYSRDWLYEYSVRTFKRPLCANRLLALRKEQEAAQKGPLPQEVIASQAANILSGGQQVNGQSQ